MRLHLGKLRNGDFQNTVDGLRLDVLRIRSLGQAEATLEFTADALDAAEAFLRFLARGLSRRPRTVSTPCSDVISTAFGSTPGRSTFRYELIRLFVDIDRRQPGTGIRGRGQRRAEQAIDFFL